MNDSGFAIDARVELQGERPLSPAGRLYAICLLYQDLGLRSPRWRPFARMRWDRNAGQDSRVVRGVSAMNAWTIELRLENLNTGKVQTLAQSESLDAETMLALVKVGARFTYDGVRYFGEKPVADPINRKLIYHCEGYPE